MATTPPLSCSGAGKRGRSASATYGAVSSLPEAAASFTPVLRVVTPG